MLVSAPVLAALSNTMCGGDSNVGYTCNEAAKTTCACENLIDKSTMGNEEMCKNHMSPTALKSELLKETRK